MKLYHRGFSLLHRKTGLQFSESQRDAPSFGVMNNSMQWDGIGRDPECQQSSLVDIAIPIGIECPVDIR